MAMLKKSEGYQWDFELIGGSTRVKITKGKDIEHLHELDPKMWTVLSCPVKGLEIDEKSLAYMDCDGDGKLRVQDIICTSKWITGVLKNDDLLLKGADSVDVEQFDTTNPVGRQLYDSAKRILANLGKDGSVISIADTSDMTAVFAKTQFNGDGIVTEVSAEDADDKAAIAAAIATVGSLQDRSGAAGVDKALVEAFYKALAEYTAWQDAAVEAPFGDVTDKVIEAYNALDAKVKDFFVRSRLASFSPDSTSSLDVQTSLIQTISPENLTGKMDEIASYPLARVDGKVEIDLSASVNPAWADKFELVKSVLCPEAKVLTESDWTALGAKFAAYSAWKTAKAGAVVESLGLAAVKELLAKDRKESLLALIDKDLEVAEDAKNMDMVDKFLRIYRDFYRLLRNFVTFHDFYDKDKKVKAVFQAGRLIVDQRECNFCMEVADMGKHSSMAAASGMYLMYCDCTTKTKPGKITIMAALTVGDIGDLVVGKNAVYYDNDGLEWDAVITKIIDNPISISQAFWSPYRRMATAIENLINKSAAEKDAKIMKEATEKINAAPAALPANGTDPAKAAPAPPFDIAKFAGIFAALGMAVGMIGTALSGLLDTFVDLRWRLIFVFLGIMLAISGPAMVMAWLKLRRRNIAPLLNANGWAVNASSKISIPFGETLTDIAKFPKLNIKDPYARKGIAPWQAWCISLATLAAVVLGLWLGNLLAWADLPSPLPRFNKVEVVEEVPVAEPAAAEVCDTLTVSVSE